MKFKIKSVNKFVREVLPENIKRLIGQEVDIVRENKYIVLVV